MNTPSPLTPTERALVALDEFPVGALLRAAVGFAILPVWHSVAREAVADWRLGIWFVAVLLMIRVVPLVLRKVVPFPSGALALWAHRRGLAKRFDSYQWRKLLWIGVGMALYTARMQGASAWETGLVVVSVGVGLVGELAWRIYGGARETAR